MTLSRAVDLVRLVADDADGDVGEVSGLVQLAEEAADVVEGTGVQQVVDEDVGVGVAEAVSWKQNAFILQYSFKYT